MWTPKRLLIKNLLAYEKSEYLFRDGEAVMINGINLFDEGQKSNGSGKSAILEALAIALTGTLLRDTTIKELVRDGQDEAEIELELYNTLTKKSLIIWRSIYNNSKSGKLELTLDGKPVGDMVSVRDGNAMILNWLGISREDLLNYYLINKENYTPFLKMADAKKKEMIGRFSQANLIDPVIEECGIDLKRTSDEILSINTQIERKTAQLEVYQEQLEQEKKPKGNLVEIEALRQEIKTLQQEFEEKKKQLPSINEEIDRLQKRLEILPTEPKGDIEKIETDIQKLEEDRELLVKEREEIVQERAKHKKNVLGKVECPECQHSFNPADPQANIAKSQKVVDKARELILEIDQEGKDLVIKLNSLKDQQTVYQNEKRRLQKVRNELEDSLSSQKKTFNIKEQALDLIQHKIEKREESISTLSLTQVNTTKILEIEEKIDQIGLEVEELDDSLTVKMKEKSKIEEMKMTFVKFKTHLSNKAIGSIEAHVNQHLQKTKTSIEVQLDGYKETRKGEIRENITATIRRNGTESSFGRMSSGEKARIEIAFVLAPQSIINSQCESGGLDLVFLDEILESVDSEGIEGIMTALDSLGKTILVITHATFDSIYDKQVTITKGTDGISRIAA